MTSTIDAATQYLARGWRVVPNYPRGKQPRGDNWQKLEIKPEELRAKFGHDENIGIITGEPSKNLVCVDMDSEVARQLAPDYLPPTPVVCGRSGNPEGHRFYVVEKSVRGRRWKLSDDDANRFGFANTVELLATGQQVVVGPSIHSTGDVYHVLEGEPATVSADELVKACEALDKAVRAKLGIEDKKKPAKKPAKPKEAKPTPELDAADDEQRSDIRDRARRYLAKIPPAVSGQGGHRRTFLAAQHLVRGFELNDQDAFDLLADWNRSCNPPWSDAELSHKIQSARTDGTTVQIGEHLKPQSVRNYRLADVATDDGNKTIPIPLCIDEITKTILRLTSGWPRRVGSAMFVPAEAQGVTWLEDADAFGAWIGRATGSPAEFKGMPGFHTKREVFANCLVEVQQYASVEELPHEPLMANHYYACEVPTPGNGDRLRELVNRFSPETDIDRDLILAMFVTPFWGGRGGCRPGFCVTADEGRGVGKTELVRSVAELCGGCIEISACEDADKIKTRLLSPDAITKRVILLDNVKTHKLSSADIEALITSSIISGRRLYVGEGQRANTMMFAMTMNGAGLSTDLAQRMVTIKLRRPEYSGTWSENTRKFIHDHRPEIIADIIGFLKSPSVTLAKFSRWGDWERDVLARLPEPAEAQAVIRERQVGVDVDAEESELIEAFFVQQLANFGFDTGTDRIFIPSAVAARWYCWAINDTKLPTARAARALKQRITEGTMRRITECPSRTHGRGCEYWGDDATGDTPLLLELAERIRITGDRYAG